jgi:hypothetical protein
MSSSAEQVERPRAVLVRTSDDVLTVDLEDGRTIAVPLCWFPPLAGHRRGHQCRVVAARIAIR